MNFMIYTDYMIHITFEYDTYIYLFLLLFKFICFYIFWWSIVYVS